MGPCARQSRVLSLRGMSRTQVTTSRNLRLPQGRERSRRIVCSPTCKEGEFILDRWGSFGIWYLEFGISSNSEEFMENEHCLSLVFPLGCSRYATWEAHSFCRLL